MLLSSNPVFPIFSQLGHSLACGAGKRKRICFFFVHTAERVLPSSPPRFVGFDGRQPMETGERCRPTLPKQRKRGVFSTMVKDVYYGKTLRKSFARHEEILDMPNLLEVQKNSYQWFLDTGLREVFKDVARSRLRGNLELSFIDYSMDEPPKYSVRSARPGTPRTPRPSRCGCACATRRPRRSRSRRSSWATSP